MSEVVIDTETTGLPSRHDNVRVVEVAIVAVETGATLLDTLVNPERSIPPESTGIHGIRDADVATAPTWAELRPKLGKILDGAAQIWSYNADFDEEVLYIHNEAAGCPPLPPRSRWDCVMLYYAEWVNRERWSTLAAAAHHCGVATGGHRALGDAQAARGVLLHMRAHPVECRVCGRTGGADGTTPLRG